MKETVKRRTPNNIQSKRSGKPERKDNKMLKENGGKALNAKGTKSKALKDRSEPASLVSDSHGGSDAPEVYENMVMHYVDDVNRSEETSKDFEVNTMTQEVTKDEISDDRSSLEGETSQGKEGDSDSETTKDSVSSQGDSITGEDDKLESDHRDQHIVSINCSPDHRSNRSTTGSNCENENSHSKSSNSTEKSTSSDGDNSKVSNHVSSDIDMPSAPEPSGFDSKHLEVVKEIDVSDEASNAAKSDGNDNDFLDAEEDIHHEDEAVLNEKIKEMEVRIDRLEEELREVAALEVSLYSIVPEHGSSTHKVHTPARRLSRLFIHSCKHWTQNRRATIAKNTVTGLILVAKSCGNDVSRLTFWLSNTIVLRNTISRTLGHSRNPRVATLSVDSDQSGKRSEERPSKLKWKGGASGKQVDAFMQLVHDWKETGTFTSALEKVESWIFSRIVESVWWKALAPHMQSPVNALATNKMIGKLLGPALGDQQQGSFSINLWKNAFQDAFQQLCPVRAGGHECGCLPVLATMVMEECIARLDVAMFNAILRESASEIPTDPVSDPIVDSKVLPIPAGDLSFGSGAQLKNSIGNWSRWLTDTLGMDVEDFSKEDQHNNEDDFRQNGNEKPKSFILLNALSDLLMLPKDMLIDRSIRQEVCPSIGIALIKRILCNFTPDEFCPDPVPGAVLEALNAESIIERRFSGDSATSFPYSASPVSYIPPAVDFADVEELGGRPHLSRNSSAILRKGYMSDEELEELNSPLTSIINKSPSSLTRKANGKPINGNQYHTSDGVTNARYELLHEVWTACLS